MYNHLVDDFFLVNNFPKNVRQTLADNCEINALKFVTSETSPVTGTKKYLFEKNNAPLNSAQLRYKITNIFKAHGIKTTPHQLRHSFATHLLNSGARIADVSELLGHATMATTQIYTKLADSKKLEEYLKAHPLTKKS